MALEDESHTPSWLDEENDQSHVDEIAPLFGGTTGKGSLLSSNDEEDPPQPQHAAYGAVTRADSEFEQPSVLTVDAASTSSDRVSIIITESGKPELPRRSWMLGAFKFLEMVGIVCSLCLLASQVLPIVLIPTADIGAMSFILKIYVSSFCALFVLVECDFPIGFLRNAAFLQAFLSRGFLYSFLGLSCLEEAYSERVKDMMEHSSDRFHVAWASLFMQVSAWVMLGLGVFYMLFGLCCMKRVKDKLVDEDNRRWEAYYEAMRLYKRGKPFL